MAAQGIRPPIRTPQQGELIRDNATDRPKSRSQACGIQTLLCRTMSRSAWQWRGVLAGGEEQRYAMSDASQGPGWWLASDGRWYAPETHPNYVAPPPPPPPPPPSPSPPTSMPPTAAAQPISEVPTTSVPLASGKPTSSMPTVPATESGEPTAAYSPYGGSPQPGEPEKAGPKAPIYKKWWAWVIAAVVLIVIIAISANSSKKNTNTSATIATTAAPATTAPTPVTTAAPATTAPPPAGRQVKGTLVTLGAGTFAGGKDVAVGLYDVTPPAGESGNFSTTGPDSYNEILGPNGGIGGVPMVRVTISTGDQITISGLSAVTFTPVTAPLNNSHTTTNLYAGTWTVGQDIGAGRYVATPGAGQSGNFIVSGTDSYNEILGGDSSLGGVPSVTVSLTKGDVIAISGLSQVVMTAQ